MRCYCVKAVDQAAELEGAHLLCQRRGAAHIRKQHRQDDLGPARMLEGLTGNTEAGVVLGLVPAQQTHEKAADALEGRGA